MVPTKITKVIFIRSSFYTDTKELVRANRFLDRFTAKNLAELGIPLLAAYTPSHIAVEMYDDCLEDTPMDTDAQVVAISAWIIHKDRAIDLANHFKKLGKIVVMGGYLPTMHPELIQPHVDSLCIGEGDLIWPQMIKDIEAGFLKPFYKSDFQMPLDNLPIPRYDLIKKTKLFSLSNSYPVAATRGCPFTCEYCSIISFYNRTYRQRPVDDVIRDIKAHSKKMIYFIDDNLMENKNYAKELFKKMIGLNVLWGTQGTINMANDPELLDLAYKAGCRIVMIGTESVLEENLKDVSKGWANPSLYKEQVRKIQAAGIGVHALVIFGLPNDKKDTFKKSVDFLLDAGVAAAEFFIFTPYPKTTVGQRYIKEGRIIEEDITKYREPYVVFRHDHLTRKEIQDGYWYAFNQFYSIKNNLLRLWKSNFRHKAYQLSTNFYYWIKIKRKIVPTHFQRGNYSFYKMTGEENKDFDNT